MKSILEYMSTKINQKYQEKERILNNIEFTYNIDDDGKEFIFNDNDDNVKYEFEHAFMNEFDENNLKLIKKVKLYIYTSYAQNPNYKFFSIYITVNNDEFYFKCRYNSKNKHFEKLKSDLVVYYDKDWLRRIDVKSLVYDIRFKLT